MAFDTLDVTKANLGDHMKQRISALSKLGISVLFMLTVLQPVKALESPVETIRLNLILSDEGNLEDCSPVDPVLSSNDTLNWVSVGIPEDSVEERIHYYTSCSAIEEAYVDSVSQLAMVPRDPSYATEQWNLKYMDLEQAWDITVGSSDVVVAVVDTGVDVTSAVSDFAPGTVLNGVSILYDDITDLTEIKEDSYVGQYSYDGGSHGTAVASIIAAAMNTKGITGIAPGVKILPVKVFNDAVEADEITLAANSSIALGIVWAVDHGADIINLSLGGFFDDPLLRSAVEYAFDHQVIVVAASGNTSDHDGSYTGIIFRNDVSYPAAYPSVIAVGSVNFGGMLSNFSDIGGQGIDLVGYGEGITLPWRSSGKLERIDGTSFAAPSVAGVLALVLSKYPDLSPIEAEAILYQGAKDVPMSSGSFYYADGNDWSTGYGIVNAYGALQSAQAFVTINDGDNDLESSTELQFDTVYNGEINPVLDADYYCFETYQYEMLLISMVISKDFVSMLRIYQVDANGNLNLLHPIGGFTSEVQEPVQRGLPKGKYCIVVNSRTEESYRNGSYTLKVSYQYPILPTISLSNAGGTLPDDATSYDPVTVNFTGSYTPKWTATRNGEAYVVPTNRVFTEPGTYVVTLDDGHATPLVAHFTISDFQLSGIVDGKSYLGPITLTFNADTATINGEPLISGTTVSTEGTYHLVFTKGGTEYVANFAIDKTGPIIYGLDRDKYIDSSPIVTFTEGRATLNGLPFTSGSVINKEGRNELNVYDDLGNVTIRVINIVTQLWTERKETVGRYDSIEFYWGSMLQNADYFLISQVDPITQELSFLGKFPYSLKTTLTGLKPNTLYTYSVVACVEVEDKKLCSEPMIYASKTTKLYPVIFYPKVIDYQTITGEWNPIQYADGYDIYVNDVYIESITATKYTFNLPTPTSTTYSPININVVAYRMVDGVKETGQDYVYKNTQFWPMLQSPVVTSSTLEGQDSYTLTWNAVTSATKYRVYYTDAYYWPDQQYVEVEGTSATITGLRRSARYNFKVIAYAQLSDTLTVSGSSSNQVTGYTAPATPTLITELQGINTIRLIAYRVATADRFEFYEWNESTQTYDLITSQFDAQLAIERTQGQTYTYKVRARSQVHPNVFSDFSEPVTLTVSPAATSGWNVHRIEANSVVMSWGMNTPKTGYELFYAKSPEGPYTSLGETTEPSWIEVNGLDFNTTYYFKYKPYLMVGETRVNGAFSSIQSVKTALSAIEEFYAGSIAYNTNLLEWTAVPGASGYEIYAEVGTSRVATLVKAVTTTTFTHTGLVTNTEYRYVVKPYRYDGTTKVYGPTTPYSAATPIPAAPEVSADMVSATSIKVSWPAVAGATGYEVSYAYYGGAASDYITKPLQTATSLTLTGLPIGNQFMMLVRAYRLVGTVKVYGDYGLDFVMTSTANPTLTSTSPSPSSLKLSWSAVLGAQGYELVYFNPKTRLFEVLTSSTALTYTQTGLKTGERHLYLLRSYIENNLGRIYSINAQYISAASAPSAVTGAKVMDPKTTQLTLTWNASPEATGYEITRSTSATGTFTLVANVEGALTYTNTGLVFNTTYYYKIRPFTTMDGVKTYGTPTAAFSGKTALDTVLNPSAKSTAYNTNVISWTPVTGVTTYEVYYSIGTSTSYVLLKTVSGTSYTHTALVTNTTYNYKIRATKTVNLVKYVGGFSSVVSSKPLPTAPMISAVSTGTDSIRVSWPVVAGATGYEVTTSLYADFSSPTTTIVTANVFNRSGLATDVPLYIKVRAYRLVGTVKVYGAESNSVSVKPIPNTPVLTGVVADYQGIRLSWTSILNASGYELYKQNASSGTFELVQDNNTLSYSENGLVTGSINIYKVKAYVMVNEIRVYSFDSSVVSLIPIPSLVTGFQVIMPKYNELSLVWNAVVGATGYEISRSTSTTGTYTPLTTIEEGTTFTDRALPFNTAYAYKIRAYTIVNDVKVYGNTTSYVVGKTALETVVEPKAVYTSYNTNAISWSAVPGASGYQVYRSIGTSTSYALLATVTGTAYNNTSLVTNTRYNYKIRAYRLVGTMKIYGGFSAVVSSRPLPMAPKPAVGSSGYNSLSVSWPVVSGAHGYEVSFATSENGTFTKLSLVTKTYASIGNLQTNTLYYVRVRAYRVVNYVKVYGAYSWLVTGTPIPSLPVVSAVSVNYDSIKLSWPAVGGASGYEVFAQTSASIDYVLVEDTTALTKTVTGLVTGSAANFKVRAYRFVNNVKVYSVDSVVKTATPIPATVSGFKVAMPSVASLKLAWSPVNGATGYEIFKSTSVSGTYALIGTVEALTEFAVTGLVFNNSTYYKVRAYTLVGDVKVYGLSTVALAGKTIPSTVQLTATNLSYNTNQLDWPAIEGASGYEIYVSTNTSTYYTILKTLTVNTFKHTALSFNVRYNYKVRAYRLVGTTKVYGAFSTVMSVKTAVSAPSVVPTITHDSVGLTWVAVSGAAGYEVSIGTSPNGPFTLSLQTALSKTYTGLTTGTTYYVRVRAYRLVSTTKVYGAYSALLTVTPHLEVPMLSLTGLSASSATLSWTAVTGASDYEIRIKSDAADAVWFEESVSELSVTFDDLDPLRKYTVQIRAVKKINEIPVVSDYSEALTFAYSETQ